MTSVTMFWIAICRLSKNSRTGKPSSPMKARTMPSTMLKTTIPMKLVEFFVADLILVTESE